MTTVLGGLAGTTTAVGFGNSATGLSVVGGTIDTTGVTNMAFSAPRDGTVTAIAAQFSLSVAATLVGSTVTLTAQLYSAPAASNTFAPVAGALVTLAPPLTGVVAIGTNSSGLATGLAIPVVAGTRLMLVFSAAVTAGIDIATAITGFASAGLTIE
ncbi:exosporium glycoprotein BclB-related protein [Faecalispora jeddahensis]|uniref:exosporium glycoprotein BclB-related protein n=1 Tax=Faecalispora jeddahensis TaxID=1414721 RepID=UPI0004B23D67|nr:exosporium glycoprotein BclB-related protein [Faecalispora jeddahensis]